MQTGCSRGRRGRMSLQLTLHLENVSGGDYMMVARPPQRVRIIPLVRCTGFNLTSSMRFLARTAELVAFRCEDILVATWRLGEDARKKQVDVGASGERLVREAGAAWGHGIRGRV